MLIILRFTVTGMLKAALKLASPLFMFLSFFKSSFWLFSPRHKLSLHERISWILGKFWKPDLCNKEYNCVEQKSQSWKKIVVDNDIHSPMYIISTKIFKVKWKPPEFEGQLWPEILVVSLQQPVLDLINKDGEDDRVGPDVLVLQTDQVTAMGGNFVELAEQQSSRFRTYLSLYLILRAEKK